MVGRYFGPQGACIAACLAAACSEAGGGSDPKRLDKQTLVPAMAAEMKPCDEANERFSALAQQDSPDAATAQTAALAGAKACKQGAERIKALPVLEDLTDVRTVCADAYVAKGDVLELAGKLDYSLEDPSGVEELRRRATDAEAKIQTCLREAGVTAPG